MLQLLPGIEAGNELAAALHIRGGNPDQNLVLWDVSRFYHSGHLFGIYSVFNPYAVAEMKVYRGSFSARYGGRIAGLIDISGHSGQPDSLSAGIGLNLVNTQAYVKTPLGKKSSPIPCRTASLFRHSSKQHLPNLFQQVNVESKIGRNANNEGEDSAVLSAHPTFVFSDWNLKGEIEVFPGHKASLGFFNGTDRLQYQVEQLADTPLRLRDRLKVCNEGLSARWQSQWNEREDSELVLAFSNYRNRYNFETLRGDPASIDRYYEHRNQLREWNLHLGHHIRWQKTMRWSLVTR